MLYRIINQKITTPYWTSTKKHYETHLHITFSVRLKKSESISQGKETIFTTNYGLTKLPDFKPLTEEQVVNLIQDLNHTTCAVDPCYTKFLMEFKHTSIQTITKIINILLTTGQYLEKWKIAAV